MIFFELDVENTLKSKNAAVFECLMKALNCCSRYLACELNLARMMTKMLSIDVEINSAGKDQLSTLQ